MNEISTFLDHLLPHYGAPIGYSVLAIIGGRIVFSVLSRTLGELSAKGFLDYRLRILLGRASKWLIVIVVILLSLGFFGMSVGTLWAALSGVLALIAVGFVATWSVLSNFLCSILLIIFPPFRIGDQIEIQEPTSDFAVKGKVVSTNMMFTCLQVNDRSDGSADNLLRVPNNIFFQKYVRVIPGKTTESLQNYTARQDQES